MENYLRIEESGAANQIESLRLKRPARRCIYYSEECCSAPNLRFEACRTCYRVSPQLAVKRLFEVIRKMATDLLKLTRKEPGQFPQH